MRVSDRLCACPTCRVAPNNSNRTQIYSSLKIGPPGVKISKNTQLEPAQLRPKLLEMLLGMPELLFRESMELKKDVSLIEEKEY